VPVSEPADSIRVLFSSPAYWPALAFGGPIWEARELNGGMVRRGHQVEVLTTTLVDIEHGRSWRTTSADVDGARVHYLATPVRYRWMGITPSAPVWLHRIERPQVAHIFGFRDPIGTAVAAWCRLRAIPYVFEPLGMFPPRLRKVRFKRAFDTTLQWLAGGAAAVVVTSEHEGHDAIACGAREDRVTVRGNGFPPPAANRLRTGALRGALGLGDEPLILSVGRIASGKGVELLLETVRRIPGAHLALVGPDDGHGVSATVAAAQRSPLTAGRVHRLEPTHRPLDLYADADVFVLASAGESFGMVAAEAAAAGTPVVVTDRCGVSEFLADGGAIVVPHDIDAVHEAIGRVLDDPALQERLSAAGRAVAASLSWDVIVDRQERIYREAIESEH
jgi:glycosyltransferase involved in cell wall biosynthesis